MVSGLIGQSGHSARSRVALAAKKGTGIVMLLHLEMAALIVKVIERKTSNATWEHVTVSR